MAVLKLLICAIFLTVFSIESANAGLIVRQIADFANNTLGFQSLNNIEAHISIIGDAEDAEVNGDADKSDGFEQIELTAELGLTKLYTLGKRLPGDRLLAQGSKSLSWQTPHSVNITLSYPTRGVGGLVHYVLIAVEQTNLDGRAYVVNGGINQRHITIAVEAVNVMHFYLNVNIYGK